MASTIHDFEPDAVVHFAEQRSAPYSMIDRKHAVFTQVNNVVGTLNLLFALREFEPDCHLVKLGTMGEYGTPNIDIEEGYIRSSTTAARTCFPSPSSPARSITSPRCTTATTSCSACKAWGLRATDLNQGVVYGTMTDETALDEALINRFDYDEVFGTVLNRFCIAGGGRASAHGLRQGRTDPRLPRHSRHRSLHRNCLPESGRSRRVPGLQPVHRAVLGAGAGADGASRGQKDGAEGAKSTTCPIRASRPRAHYYNAKHSKLIDLGLQPHLLSDSLIDSLIDIAMRYSDRIDTSVFMPQ